MSLNLHAANPDPCKDVMPSSARGTCRAYYNSCFKDVSNPDEVNCLRLRELWTERTGLPNFPFENPPPPPVTCPCNTDAVFSGVLTGQYPMIACQKFPGNQIFTAGSAPGGNCQAGVGLNGSDWMCGGACSVEARITGIKDYMVITAEQAAKCYLDLEAAADAQGVTCTISTE